MNSPQSPTTSRTFHITLTIAEAASTEPTPEALQESPTEPLKPDPAEKLEAFLKSQGHPIGYRDPSLPPYTGSYRIDMSTPGGL